MNRRVNRVPARRLARRLGVFARLEERLDRRWPRGGGVSPEVMRIIDRVVMGDPEEMAAPAWSVEHGGAAAPPHRAAPGSAAPMVADDPTRFEPHSHP